VAPDAPPPPPPTVTKTIEPGVTPIAPVTTAPLAPPPAACALTELDPAWGADVEVVLDADV